MIASKVYGGGMVDLTKHQKSKETLVPPSIQLLFHNEKLDVMKLLCLINALSIQSKKQRKVSEILFYYSLVNFDLINLFEKNGEDSQYNPSSNLYYRFQIKVKKNILNMSNLDFIEIRGNMSDKTKDINVKLLPKGIQFFQENTTDYLLNLQDKYISAYELVKFSAVNLQKIKEGRP